MLYKVVVQMMLLYEVEIWVVIDAIMTVMEGFHHRVTHRIAGLMAIRGDNGKR